MTQDVAGLCERLKNTRCAASTRLEAAKALGRMEDEMDMATKSLAIAGRALKDYDAMLIASQKKVAQLENDIVVADERTSAQRATATAAVEEYAKLKDRVAKLEETLLFAEDIILDEFGERGAPGVLNQIRNVLGQKG